MGKKEGKREESEMGYGQRAACQMEGKGERDSLLDVVIITRIINCGKSRFSSELS